MELTSTQLLRTEKTIPYLEPAAIRHQPDLTLISPCGKKRHTNRLLFIGASSLARALFREDDLSNSISVDCSFEGIEMLATFIENGTVPVSMTAEMTAVFLMCGIDLSALRFTQIEEPVQACVAAGVKEELGDDDDDEGLEPVWEDGRGTFMSVNEDEFKENEDIEFEEHFSDSDLIDAVDIKEELTPLELPKRATKRATKRVGEKSGFCEICQKHFSAFKSHMVRAHSEAGVTPIECPVCHVEYIGQFSLRKHVLKKHKKRICVTCKKTFSTLAELEEHRTTDHPRIADENDAGNCPHCGVYKVSLKRHIAIMHDDTQMQCQICQEVFVGNFNLKEHIKKMHADANEFICKLCGKRLTTATTLKKHLTYVHGEVKTMPFKCRYCPKSFTHKYILGYHENKHTNTMPYKCRQCDKRFYNHVDRYSHEAKAHEMHPKSSTNAKPVKRVFKEERIPCDECGRMLKGKATLQNHKLIVHTKSEHKPFQCEICAKGFSIKIGLKSHMEIKHPERFPLRCQVCGRGAETEEKLKRHQDDHYKEYPCPNCGKVFKNPNVLKNHESLVHGNMEDRPFPCTLCKMRFLSTSKLKEHMIHHENKRQYKCTVCGKGFNVQANVKRHMNSMHNANK